MGSAGRKHPARISALDESARSNLCPGWITLSYNRSLDRCELAQPFELWGVSNLCVAFRLLQKIKYDRCVSDIIKLAPAAALPECPLGTKSTRGEANTALEAVPNVIEVGPGGFPREPLILGFSRTASCSRSSTDLLRSSGARQQVSEGWKDVVIIVLRNAMTRYGAKTTDTSRSSYTGE